MNRTVIKLDERTWAVVYPTPAAHQRGEDDWRDYCYYLEWAAYTDGRIEMGAQFCGFPTVEAALRDARMRLKWHPLPPLKEPEPPPPPKPPSWHTHICFQCGRMTECLNRRCLKKGTKLGQIQNPIRCPKCGEATDRSWWWTAPRIQRWIPLGEGAKAAKA